MRFFKLPSLLYLLLLCIGLQNCLTPKASVITKKYPRAALEEDALLMENVIMTMHPAVGLYEPRSYYSELFKSLRSSLPDSLTEKEFRLKIKLALDELHCGHTEVMPSKQYYHEVKPMLLNYSPYIFLTIDDKIRIVANLNKKQDSTLQKGQEITSINGITVDSLAKHIQRYISADGFNRTSKEHFMQLEFNNYFPSIFGRPDTFRVSYKEAGTIKELSYAAIKLKSMPALPLGAQDDSLFTHYRRSKIKYRYLDTTQQTLLMKIAKFSHKGWHTAYSRLFRKMNKAEVPNLVIDLRNNGGGSLVNAYKLLSYLIDTTEVQTLSTPLRNYPYKKYTKGNVAFKFTRLAYRFLGDYKTVNDTDYFSYKIKPREKNHYKGRIFICINGGSFSASCLVAAYLEKNPRVTLIGEETGGAREGCNAGVTPYYRLPNTGLRVRVPAFRVTNDISPEITGRGIIPDYQTSYSFKDIVGRRDVDLEKVIELINMPR